MRNPQNINDLVALNPDYIGFIFYEKSPRYVETRHATSLQRMPKHIKKVGVFVNETTEKILETVENYDLDVVQLHGSESPEFCKNLKQKLQNVSITKAINIENVKDIQKTNMYNHDCCDYFLFDTKTHLPGGSGTQFDWWTLNWYNGDIPFFLAGGISENDAKKIQSVHHAQFYGIDINSKFELEPGLKDIEKVKQFFNEIKQQ